VTVSLMGKADRCQSEKYIILQIEIVSVWFELTILGLIRVSESQI